MTAMLQTRHPSQRVAYAFFAASAALLLLQVLFGLIIAAQYVWPTFLMNELPFNVGRATHLNLLTFWSLLGLMGATYYLVPDETDSELFSVPLAYVQLAVMLAAGVGALIGMWFFGASRGKPFTEAAMPWPYVIALGAVLFLVNIGATIVRSRRWTAITVVLFGGMAGLALLYLINLFTFANLVVDYFWWWWIIHLWVEGTWELVAAAVMAYLLIAVTGVERARMQRWLYVEVSLVLFTGILGIGHHYYWIGTPRYWLLWGAAFSALEPIPLALMAYDAMVSMKRRRVEPVSRVAWYWLGGTAIGHLLGAGVWGLAMTLPQINKWTHGTQVTASHGHFAFYGAIAMLVIAAAYTMLPRLQPGGAPALRERRGLWAFWLMTTGMLAMVAAFTIAGVVQVYLHRMLGLDFMTVRTQYVAFWIFWVWISGLVLFLPGCLMYLRDCVALRGGAKLTAA
jgi:nitric oxide reductase subunit B